MLRLFVHLELMDVETAHGMLAWPHSGFHVHDGVWVAADGREFAVRLARYLRPKPRGAEPPGVSVRQRHGHLPL